MFLEERVATAGDLVLEPDVGERLILGPGQLVLLLLHQLHPVQLLGTLLVQLLHALAQQLNRLLQQQREGGGGSVRRRVGQALGRIDQVWGRGRQEVGNLSRTGGVGREALAVEKGRQDSCNLDSASTCHLRESSS